MYKDLNKQREANRKAQARFKAKAKGITTSQGITDKASIDKYADELSVTARDTKPKRGKDIKCFEDLPPDIQATIRRVSESNEEFQRRKVIAIQYQHLFPDRYHSTGIAI